MYSTMRDQLRAELEEIRAAGTFKNERHIDSPQSGRIAAGRLGEPAVDVLNFCAKTEIVINTACVFLLTRCKLKNRHI